MSYLSERFQCVCSGDSYSSLLPVPHGVPQGSVLGPFLFSVYVNDFPSILQKCETHMYADDIQLVFPCEANNIQFSVNTINQELRSISQWAKQNRLKINPSKFKYMIIHNVSRSYENVPEITIDDTVIERVEKAKNLGVIFTHTLSWNQHIICATGKVNGMLRTLWPTQHFTPSNIRLLIAKSYLLPILLYGCELYANADSAHLTKLNTTFNNIARYIYGLSRYASVSGFAYRINNISFANFLKVKVLILLHKIIFLQEPIYLFERLRFSMSARNNDIIPIRHTRSSSERQFFLYAPSLWNSLNSNLQNTRSAIKFKRDIFDYFNSLTNN